MKKVVIVEDDSSIREVLEIILMSPRYSLITCPNSKSYLEVVDNNTPDLILMDVMLPDGNGLDLCRHTKEIARLQDVPMLIMSAQNYRKKSLECGAAGFIEKPFDITKLRITVDSFL